MRIIDFAWDDGNILHLALGHGIQPEEAETPSGGAQILDLTELLQRSLKKGKSKGDQEKAPAKTSGKVNAANASNRAGDTHKRRTM